MLEICNKCKWKDIQEPNKCQTCKHNMLEKQDYYEKNDREVKDKEKKAVTTEGRIEKPEDVLIKGVKARVNVPDSLKPVRQTAGERGNRLCPKCGKDQLTPVDDESGYLWACKGCDYVEPKAN